MKKLLFLINPISGVGRGTSLASRIASGLQGRLPQSDYDIIFTTADVTGQARELAPRYETIVAAGGDGTLSRVARGLVDQAARTRLGIIPLGTGNDCARSLGVLPVWKQGGLSALLDLMLAGATRPVDMFTFGTRSMFINYAGLGRDAAVAAMFDRLRSRTWVRPLCDRGGSKLLYALIALACSRTRCAPGIELSWCTPEGATETIRFSHPACQLVICNIDSYGGGVRFSSTTRMDDGLFEIAVMRGSARWLLLHLGRLTGRAYDRVLPPGAVIRAREMRLYTGRSSFAQIDGETVAVAPDETLEVRPAARLRMLAASP